MAAEVRGIDVARVSAWIAANLAAGRLDLDALITARRPLGEINEALADLRAAKGSRASRRPFRGLRRLCRRW